MRDLNFFLPYIESNKESKKTDFILYILIGSILIYVVGTTIWYFANKLILNENIQSLKAEINNTNLQQQYKKAGLTLAKYELFNKYNQGVNTSIDNITSKEMGTSSIMRTIFSTLPKEVAITSISITNSTLQLQCTSSNRVSIAELQRNLLQLDMITSADVSGLSGDSTKNSYGFLVKCTLKGVDVK